MAISQPLLDKINAAEDKLQTAVALDRVHEQAVVALHAAEDKEVSDAGAAMQAHKEASAAALDAVTALKAELGIS